MPRTVTVSRNPSNHAAEENGADVHTSIAWGTTTSLLAACADTPLDDTTLGASNRAAPAAKD